MFSDQVYSNLIWQQMIPPRGRKCSNSSSKKLFHVWDVCVCVPRCRAGCHELVPVRMAPRRVDGFVSTCVMKDIWSIKAYSFSVPFYWWARGRPGQHPQAFSALAGQGVQHTDTHSCTHTSTQTQIYCGRISFMNPSYPVLISSLCALDCRES